MLPLLYASCVSPFLMILIFLHDEQYVDMYADLGPTTHSSSPFTASLVKRDPGDSSLLTACPTDAHPYLLQPLSLLFLRWIALPRKTFDVNRRLFKLSYRVVAPTPSNLPILTLSLIFTFNFTLTLDVITMPTPLLNYTLLLFFSFSSSQRFSSSLFTSSSSFSGCASCWSVCATQTERSRHIDLSSYSCHARTY